MCVVLVQRCTRVHVYVAIFMMLSNPAHTIEYASTTDFITPVLGFLTTNNLVFLITPL